MDVVLFLMIIVGTLLAIVGFIFMYKSLKNISK